MKTLNRIGLNIEKSEKLADLLNDLLSNYSVFYQNIRGYHWNLRGEKFFELHGKFEELYTDLFLKIDEIAERTLTLGKNAEHNSSKYIQISDIKESSEVSNGYKAVEEILNAFKTLLLKQRIILDFSAEINDEGTNSQMSDYIREQEKLVWMYSAFLNKN